MFEIRGAQVGEAERLTALCVRSKAHWGYDAEFMRLSAPSLRINSTDIALGRVLVAVDAETRIAGVASVMPEHDGADLGVLFVDPPFMGQGVGRLLFKAAVRAAYMIDARHLTILADPNAATFYERMGARHVRDAPSDAIPGRSLPLYEYAVTYESAS